jgi:RNAse (barnase) inhibitor barstar
MEEKLLHCGIQWKKTTSIIPYYGRKTPALWDTTKKFVSHPEIAVRCISQRKKLLPLYPPTKENLLCFIPQRKNAAV